MSCFLNKRFPFSGKHPTRQDRYRLPVTAGRVCDFARCKGNACKCAVARFAGGKPARTSMHWSPGKSQSGDFGPLSENEVRTLARASSRPDSKFRIATQTPPFSADVIVTAATDLTGDRQTSFHGRRHAYKAGASQAPATVRLAIPSQPLGRGAIVPAAAITQMANERAASSR